jgi:hypothetical protein
LRIGQLHIESHVFREKVKACNKPGGLVKANERPAHLCLTTVNDYLPHSSPSFQIVFPRLRLRLVFEVCNVQCHSSDNPKLHRLLYAILFLNTMVVRFLFDEKMQFLAKMCQEDSAFRLLTRIQAHADVLRFDVQFSVHLMANLIVAMSFEHSIRILVDDDDDEYRIPLLDMTQLSHQQSNDRRCSFDTANLVLV